MADRNRTLCVRHTDKSLHTYFAGKKAQITAQKMKFSIKDFFSKCDQIRRFLQIGHIYWRNPLWKTSFFVQ